MKDPALLAYLEAIEEAFSRKLGREFVLSPPDFALARGWMAARIPIVNVLAGIDDAFAGNAKPGGLVFCRPFVER